MPKRASGLAMRFWHRIGLTLAGVLLLAGCGARELAGLSPVINEATQQQVLIATTRSDGQLGNILGEDRRKTLRFASVDVSVPPTHRAGQLEWRSDTPDPRTEFAITDFTEIETPSAFRRHIARSRGSRPNEVLVYVHGYNTTAAEALFRAAQIQEDFAMDSPMVLFSWPSAGQATGYVYDRDSVLYSRDDLDALLSHLTRGNTRVLLVGHSMGSQLIMETLRQLSLSNKHRVLRKLDGVVLMSPDIDPDVFRRQAAAIGKLPQPFVIFAARQDRALGLSAFLTGSRTRVGGLTDARELGRPDVAVVDFSDFATGENFDHLVPVTSPAAIAFLKQVQTIGAPETSPFHEYVSISAQID